MGNPPSSSRFVAVDSAIGSRLGNNPGAGSPDRPSDVADDPTVIIPPVSQESTASGRSPRPALANRTFFPIAGFTKKHGLMGFLRRNAERPSPPSGHAARATAAAELFVAAVRSVLTIVLYGDYDVDGTAGRGHPLAALRQTGASRAPFYINRSLKRLGLNATAVRRLVEDRSGVLSMPSTAASQPSISRLSFKRAGFLC